MSRKESSPIASSSTAVQEQQRDHLPKPVLLIIFLVSITFAFGLIASRQFDAESSIDAGFEERPTGNVSYDAVSPAVEYVYGGGKLLAAIQATRPVPADLAIWRPSTGSWWVLGSGTAGYTTQSWGMNGDVPVPGDYDGDGKTDFSVFRRTSGEWYILRSSDNSSSVWTWGVSMDTVAQADYDGDGKTDRAVWRSANGTWYIVRSSDQSTLTLNYGLSGDIPAPSDYDGDDRADIAVWRTQGSSFYSINSSDNAFLTIPFAQPGSLPVSADYDGDNRSDYAIKSGNTWRIRKSSNGQMETVVWQDPADIPVQNDYDGDGRVDIAVWRNSNGNWYLRQSSLLGLAGELRQVAWGVSGDIPVPAYYRR